jgi:catechol 2,3-dioxygenase
MTSPTSTATPTAPKPVVGIQPAGFRLPPSARPGRVVLQVADLDRSLAYYGTVLGLRVLARDAGHATLGAHDDPRVLVELRELPGARPVPPRGRLGLYHFALLLPDRAALGRFLARVGDLRAPVGMSDHLVSEAIYLTDPDGLGIEVYADRPRDTWRVRDRQLAMATEPLDVEDVLAAGRGLPWDGAPAGTTVGHVHLHVGDLERAKAFYHHGLGLDQVVWSYPGALFLSAGGYHHHLGVNTWARGAEPAGPGDARLLEWEVLLPGAEDATRALASLAGVGAVVESSPDGGTTRDPWDVGLRLRAAS